MNYMHFDLFLFWVEVDDHMLKFNVEVDKSHGKAFWSSEPCEGKWEQSYENIMIRN